MNRIRMSQFAGAIVLLLGITFTSLDAQAQLDKDSKTFRMVESLNEDLESALNTGQFYNVSGMYADNARIITQEGQTVSGKKAISEYFESNRDNKKLDLEVLEVGGSGKTLYQVGRATEISENGDEIVNDFLIVWERQADWEYKIYLDTL